jgi:hypothetical protein
MPIQLSAHVLGIYGRQINKLIKIIEVCWYSTSNLIEILILSVIYTLTLTYISI